MTTSVEPFSIDPASVVRKRLPNGLTVLVRQNRSAPVVAIVTYVNVGYFDETDDAVGIAHVLEHMYFKGTPTRGVGEIAKQTKAVGGYLNAGTIYDHTNYYTVLPSSGFEQGLEVQADAYANSLIDGDELARELEVIIQETKRKADNPSAMATETLYELLHDRHRIRRWRMGREPALRAMNRDALLGFYRNFYHPGTTVLTIVGDVDPEVALDQVERLYGPMRAGEPSRAPGPNEEGVAGFRYREWSGDIGQTQLAMGWRTPGMTHPDTPVLDLLAALLGSGRASRLFQAVRDRRLASSITAYNYTPTEIGVFVVHAETPPATTLDAARAIWAQLEAVRDGDFGELELERAKRLFEARWVGRLEDMEGQANYLAEWETLGDWRMGDRYLERLLGQTREDVALAARRYLAPDNAAVLVYRPSSSLPIAADAEAMRDRLAKDQDTFVLPQQPPYHARPLPAPRTPRFDREEAGVRVYRTSSGVPILVRRKVGAPLLYAGLYLLGGARDEEPDLAGLTTLMVRAATRGTAHRTAQQVAEAGELLGGSVAGAASGESFGWTIAVPTRHAAAAIELLGDVAQYPAMPDDGVETERAVAMANVIALRDDMYRYPTRLATRAAFAGHPYGVPVLGTEESLQRIDASALRKWHAERVLAATGVIALVGDADPDELATLAERAFGGLGVAPANAVPAPIWPRRVVTQAETRDRAQSALTMLFPAPPRRDPRRFATALLASVSSGQGGRLFDELREKRSLCYTVHAAVGEREQAGTFSIYIATSPEQEEAAREGVLGEVRRLREEPVTPEELARSQTYAIGVHAIRQEGGGAVMADVVDAWLFGDLKELKEFDEHVRTVTADSMQQVAREYLDPSRRAEGVVRGGAPAA